MRKGILLTFVLGFLMILTSPVLGANWIIVKGTGATEMDSLAADELKKYVEQMTGKEVPIITNTETPATINIFLVGKADSNPKIQEFVDRGLINISATVPGPEGFINKTVDVDGKHYVVLAGCDKLGVQYAVYDFLESYCKVGFLLDGDSVPHIESLEVNDLDVSKTPFCPYRQHSVYGKGMLWYGCGTWASLSTFEKDGYKTGWKDFIDWMMRKKQNVLYLKRGFFNIGYIRGFSELDNPVDIENIESDGWWFTSDFTAEYTKDLIAYAKSRGMKTCYTATICRIPDCFKKYIEDPTHQCYGLDYVDKGSWLSLDPLDERSYTYCLQRHVNGIISEFGAPDFWYGYYAWSEHWLPQQGMTQRSYSHYRAYEHVFKNTGGSLQVYTWDWGRGTSVEQDWEYFKSVMPKDGSVILIVNHKEIPSLFLNDPEGVYGGWPWWKYLTVTSDFQFLPEKPDRTGYFCHLTTAYDAWKILLQKWGDNPPHGFGIDNMIHHVDQRLTDFESCQSILPNADKISLGDYLADYTQRAYATSEPGSSFDNLYEAQKLWAAQHELTIAQVEQYMVPEWFRLKNNIIYKTDLTEALYYKASDYDKCALIYDKWIYSREFTKEWADRNIPDTAWVSGRGMWNHVVKHFPDTDIFYEYKKPFYGDIQPGSLTVKLEDESGNPFAETQIKVMRGYLTKIEFQESFDLTTNAQGNATVDLKPDVYEVTVPGTDIREAVLMLHNRDKSIIIKTKPVITINLDLSSGWNMISLPVIPPNPILSVLFPGVEVVYGFKRGAGYKRVPEEDVLEVRNGYWILLNKAQTYPLTGIKIEKYNLSAYSGWDMIGGCSSTAKPSANHCNIVVIYRYIIGSGYERVLETEPLKPGEGYWILFNDIDPNVDIAKLIVEII